MPGGIAPFLPPPNSKRLVGESWRNFVEKVHLLLNSWQQNSWLTLDAEGFVCLFNNQPVKRPGKWGMSGANRLDGVIELGRIHSHGLHWEKCLVKLSLTEQPQPLTITLDMHNVNRMDCWI